MSLLGIEPETPDKEWSYDGECACPWCGVINRDLWEYADGDHAIECDECEKPLHLEVITERTYTLSVSGKA